LTQERAAAGTAPVAGRTDAHSEHTLILRQNKSAHFEAPFLIVVYED
jgi:hypothetical protein